MRRALVLLVPALFGCTRENDVHLSLGAPGATPIGYRCRDATGTLLDRRAVDTQAHLMRVSVVTDFIALNGYPSCRANDLYDWCTNQPCNALPQSRSCIELEASFAPLDNPATVMGQILAQLPGHVVATDAPDQALLIRVTATTQACSALGGSTAFDPNQLTGCSFSCPVQLDQVTGEIRLDLPTFTDRCEDGVLACAGAILR